MKELGYGNIGFINLAIIYGSFCIFSLSAVVINRKLGHRMTLFLSSSLYAIWAFVFMLPAYKYQNKANLTKEELESGWLSDTSIITCSLISAFLVGLGAGPLWVSQNCFLSECSSHENKGRFMTLFFGIYQFANIVGNIIAGELIDKIEKTTFYFVMGVIGLVGSLMFLVLRKPIEINSDEPTGNDAIELANTT